MIIENLKKSSFEIQSFIDPKASDQLERLYESAYALKAYTDIYFPNSKIFVFRKFGAFSEVQDILLFELKGKSIELINQFCKIDPETIKLFCRVVFKRFPKVQKISFYKLFEGPKLDGLTFFFTESPADFIIFLPEDIQQYRSMLSKNMKHNLNRSFNRLKRDFPKMLFETLEREQITRDHISKAVELNFLRMQAKGIKSELSKKAEGIFQLAKQYGYISMLKIEQEICAINIAYIVGKKFYHHIIAHHPRYNYYRLGQVNLYFTIEQMINRGCPEYHFLWGEFDYKYRFKAQKIPLYSFDVLRHKKYLKWKILMNRIQLKKQFFKGITAKRVFRFLRKKIKNYQWLNREPKD